MNEHDNNKSKSNAHIHELETGHKMNFDDIEILDRASNDLKLSLKEMLYIRKLKPKLNKQLELELFTLIIRNVRQENSITRDIQKYLKNNNNNKKYKKWEEFLKHNFYFYYHMTRIFLFMYLLKKLRKYNF